MTLPRRNFRVCLTVGCSGKWVKWISILIGWRGSSVAQLLSHSPTSARIQKIARADTDRSGGVGLASLQGPAAATHSRARRIVDGRIGRVIRGERHSATQGGSGCPNHRRASVALVGTEQTRFLLAKGCGRADGFAEPRGRVARGPPRVAQTLGASQSIRWIAR